MKGVADFGKGSPANPMSDDELFHKFRECAAWGGLDAQQAQAVIDVVWRIDEIDDVGVLTNLLRGKTN